MDVQSIYGRSVLQDDYPPFGTTIEARVNGQECGTTTTGPMGQFGTPKNHQFFIFGDGERAGCARDGDLVHFTVGGLPAGEVLMWEKDRVGLGPQLFPLTAVHDYAWYWVREDPNPSAIGRSVTASVNGSDCAEATIVEAFPGFSPGPRPIGFSRLAVPSEDIKAGCGRVGATVTFTVGGLEVTAPWQPGVQRLELPLDQIQTTPTSAPPPTASVGLTPTPQPSAAPRPTPSIAPTPATFPSTGGRHEASMLQNPVILIALAGSLAGSATSIAVWHSMRARRNIASE